jgi:hypothetical protein
MLAFLLSKFTLSSCTVVTFGVGLQVFDDSRTRVTPRPFFTFLLHDTDEPFQFMFAQPVG